MIRAVAAAFIFVWLASETFIQQTFNGTYSMEMWLGISFLHDCLHCLHYQPALYPSMTQRSSEARQAMADSVSKVGGAVASTSMMAG